MAPDPEISFRLGECLRDCRIAWCSGPVLLYAAGHIAPLIAFLAHLAQGSEMGQRAALMLYDALPLAINVELDAMAAGHDLQTEMLHDRIAHGGEALPVVEARARCAEARNLLKDEIVRNAQDQARGCDPLPEIASGAARLAYRVANASEVTSGIARDAAWALMLEWAASLRYHHTPRSTAFLEIYLRWRTRTVTAADEAADRHERAVLDAHAKRGSKR